MSAGRFFPYRTAPDSIRLHIDTDTEGIDIPRGSDGSLQLYAADMPVMMLRVSVALPRRTIQEVIPPEELDQPPVAVRLIYRSIESRRRGAWDLNGDGEVFQALLALKREEWAGVAEVHAALVRTTANPGLPAGYAVDKGALLAWSPLVRLLFTEPTAPPGRHLEVIWKDFNDDDWLKLYARDHLFALDTREVIPTLLLNLAVQEAQAVLMSRATRGPTAAIRNAAYYLIVHQVWSSLLGMALRDLADTADPQQGTGPDLDEMAEGWQREILLDWATHLFPDSDPDGARERLVSRAATAHGTADIFRRIPNAIQARFKTFRAFEGLLAQLATR